MTDPQRNTLLPPNGLYHCVGDHSITTSSLQCVSGNRENAEMEIWTGIACLVADPKCKEFRRFGDEGKGAHVNVVASVTSEAEFTERVKRIVSTLDCILLELNGVQPIEKRMEEPDYPEELIMMRSTAQRQPTDLVFRDIPHLS